MKLRLGEVTFDGDARQLLRGRGEIHLSPKAFDLLKILVETRPRAVSKNELHDLLWPATFVSEANLASLVAEIREALGDNARQPSFVRTAHRFGYAFCYEAVDEANTGTGSAGGSGDSSPTATFCWLLKDGLRVPLRDGDNVLGRAGDDVIRVDSPTVSRRHARIVVTPGSATIEDLDSKNGTRLRGHRVSSAVEMADGDEIRLGSVVLRFRKASGSRTATWSEGSRSKA